MGEKLKIEVLNYLEKALYKPLPFELSVAANDQSEGWFHFHKNIWHPVGIVKASATAGKISKKDVVMDSNWKIEMEISVFGEHQQQFDSCIQVSGPTASNAYWFRSIVPHMDCEIQYQFKVVDNDSIAPLKHIVTAGTGILIWPPLVTEDEIAQLPEAKEGKKEKKESAKEDNLATSPKKKTQKVTVASTPNSKVKQTMVTRTEMPNMTASTRKRARIELVALEEEKNEEGIDHILKDEQEKFVRSNRRRKMADEDNVESTPATTSQDIRKRRLLEVEDKDDHDENDSLVDQQRSSRRSNNNKKSQEEITKTPSKKLFLSTIDTPHSSFKSVNDKSSQKSHNKVAKDAFNSISSSSNQHETLLAEAKQFFSTLRAPPIAPPLVSKARLEFHPTGVIAISQLQKEKERDVLMIHGPLMTYALSYPLLDILQRDRHITHRYFITIIRHYFSLLQQQQQETRNTSSSSKNKSSSHKNEGYHASLQGTIASEIAEIEEWMMQYAMMPTVESLFERLVPRCIGLNQEKAIVRHLRALFEDAANAGVLFLNNNNNCNNDKYDDIEEKKWYEQWRDLHYGSNYPWAMLLGPHYFLRFLIYVVTSANHPIGSVPPVSSRIKGPMFDTEKIIEEAFKMLEQESPNIFF